VTLHARPFRHTILDGLFDPVLIEQASQSWPGDDWPWWIPYDDGDQRKLAANDWDVLPPPCRELLTQMMTRPEIATFAGPGVIPDTLLWGAGMHSMGPGGQVGVHLDHDRHPKTGMLRRCNSLLYLSEWHEDWGGHLQLWSGVPREEPVRILPAANRLVLFDTRADALHSVGPLTCPPQVRRRSLAVWWYAAWPDGQFPRRPRAQFVLSQEG
jgi:hypothetical protein